MRTFTELKSPVGPNKDHARCRGVIAMNTFEFNVKICINVTLRRNTLPYVKVPVFFGFCACKAILRLCIRTVVIMLSSSYWLAVGC
jgi:hypothetical protein